MLRVTEEVFRGQAGAVSGPCFFGVGKIFLLLLGASDGGELTRRRSLCELWRGLRISDKPKAYH